MADDTDSQFTKFMILGIGQCLRRGDHDRLAGMDTQRVKVLHVTYSDAVIITVADHFIFHLLPAFQTLFHQYLRREREGLFSQNIQFLFIVTETRA